MNRNRDNTPLSSKATLLPLFAFASLGLVMGLGGFTAFHAEGLSYLTDDPAACVNCHVMSDQYEAWWRSSHRAWATCNDCHVPHDFLGKWTRKAINGWNHSVKFTTGDFHEPIMIKPQNEAVLLENCLNCHQTMVNDMLLGHRPARDDLRCVDCHGNVGHPGVD